MLESSETIEDDRIVAKCYVELGDVTKEKGEYDESLRYHRKSLAIFEQIADALSVADSHLNIAAVYKAKGELKQAMSEYEKGLTLYEDVIVDDANKNSDSGTDVSLNSSSFSDRQHTRSLSKSDETLPQTILVNVIEKDIQLSSPVHSLNGTINTSITALDLLVPSTKKPNELKNISQSMTNINDSSLNPSEKITNELPESLSSSHISDIQCINDDDILPSDLAYEKMTVEITSEENYIFETCLPCPEPNELVNQDLLVLETNPLLEETNNCNQLTNIHEDTISNNHKQADSTQRLSHCLLNKQFLIIILSILLTGAAFWLLHTTSMKFLLSCSSNKFSIHRNSRIYNNDDLSVQLKKILPWRKNQIKSLNEDNRRAIEEFLTDSENQTKMTVNKFQQILNMLDLKLVLIPR
ncbi:unnamed protein product [Rotaria sordida]|uniref:Uncharacterized protein n=2 Tax=Rotaria sordida TaxID=392033 RepID=A0A815F169_9BILA|nr:unnamed protein product [Rotaria sordida]